MQVKILYFAWVREATGCEGETVTVPDGVNTLADLAGFLAMRHPVFADTAKLRAAIDQHLAPMDASIVGAGEIAFFPPVTGG